MTREQLAGYSIYKSDAASRVRGEKLTVDSLRGPTGEALIAAILAADGEEKVYQVDGHYYAVFAPVTPPTAA